MPTRPAPFESIARDKASALPTRVRLSDNCTPCHTQDTCRPATCNHVFPVPHREVRNCVSCHSRGRVP